MPVQYPLLFTPIRFGRLEVRNRLIMTGMAGHMAPPDGSVTDREIAFYERRARGAWAWPSSAPPTCTPAAASATISSASTPTRTSRLSAPGAGDQAARGDRVDPAAPRGAADQLARDRRTAHRAIGRPCPVKQEVPHALTHEEIAEVVEWFGQGARRVREAGFDAVEIHCAHGYLPAQFLSPRANKRTDEYGGSLEHRFRFVGELIARVKREIGDCRSASRSRDTSSTRRAG
jgi:2,4-dienoyl-CoA reductase-like NADH-dependent reductase (Old Yellow Enzyme family)